MCRARMVSTTAWMSAFLVQGVLADLYNGRNLALNKDTYQSTTLGRHPADKAVDGNRYEYQSCTHTASETDPFWVVDLGEVYQIGHISITNRKLEESFVWMRLAGFVVGFRTSGHMTSRDFTEDEICHVHSGSPGNGQTVDIVCHVGGPTHARYVYVYLPGRDRYLTLCEVEVYEFTGQSSSVHWLPDRQCPSSFYTTATPNNGTEVTDILYDTNFTSCLVPADKAENRLQIMFPLTMERSRVSFKIMGRNLVCSPPRGMGALGIGHCRDGAECPSLPCTPADVVMPQQGTGCKYKCHCNPVCAAIILGISGLSSVARTWEICEIIL